MTIALGFWVCFKVPDLNCSTIGTTNAYVLPEPVCARPMILFPFNSGAMVADWISFILNMFFSLSLAMVPSEMPLDFHSVLFSTLKTRLIFVIKFYPIGVMLRILNK